MIVIPNCIHYSSFGLLQQFEIENTSSMKEIILNVTNQKVQDLLKCSLHSKTTLTDLFLQKKPSFQVYRFFTPDVEMSGSLEIILKLVIRKSDGKVLCAQGEHDFVNLLLSFLTFPLGGIARTFQLSLLLSVFLNLYPVLHPIQTLKPFET
ncbi:unnamed protein product [Vicia faba]|uniref:Uncharacterized protein n=1 Tax=Vicia faba TaxID=3906 RepID=A0AAV1AUF9_VICFA|nr:unnamed protein product [Vicia faba]